VITKTIRLFPTNEQIIQLKELSVTRNMLWNHFIEIQQNEYATNKRIFTEFDLNNLLPALRSNNSIYSKLNSKACQRVAKEIYGSYKSFFALIKKDDTAEPPNIIKNTEAFHTVVFHQKGWFFRNGLLHLNKIPIRYKAQYDYSKENIKEVCIKYVNKKWLLDLSIDKPINYSLQTDLKQNQLLSIDLGLKTLASCVDNKGNVILVHNKAKKINKYFAKHITKLKKRLANKTKYSNSWNKLNKTKQKLYFRKTKQVKQILHVQSKQLLCMNYHTIILGDLSVKELISNEKNKTKKISKSFSQTNVTMFVDFLKYKSFAYKTNLLKVDERYTTQTNCLTGNLFKEKVTLTDRVVKLADNIIIDRDLNASINIMKRYFNNHLAPMTEPLDVSKVVDKINLCTHKFVKSINL
jgi:putative transposase